MAKIMLVEDDDNLREIYGARLMAEGYDIVSAKDGEEALALAVKEKPDLIISDVMMPRISGFDMLDILRNAPETKDTKVIMMTALSQAEDKSRADKLGADRYLVKSQVTLEDVANVVHEVLEGPQAPAAEPAAPVQTVDQPTDVAPAAPEPAPAPQPAPEPPAASVPAPEPATSNPAPAPTVEAIANPVVEVQGETDPSQIQAPPASQPTDDSSTSSSTDDATDDNTLPPVVEPAEPVAAPIKVELPQPLNSASVSDNSSIPPAPSEPQSAAVQETPAEPAPVAESVASEPEAANVGPSLAEALESEESEAPATNTTAPAETETVPDIPAVANGVEIPQVTTPTTSSRNIPVTSDDTQAPMSGVNEIAGKKVIQPIGDPLAKPDLDALLAEEEEKAAVENPAANTVITPAPAPKKENDDINKIAL